MSTLRNLLRWTDEIHDHFFNRQRVPVVIASPLRGRAQRPAPGTGLPCVTAIELEALDVLPLRFADPRTAAGDVIEAGPLFEPAREHVTALGRLLRHRIAGIRTVVKDRRFEIRIRSAQLLRERERRLHALLGLAGKADDEVEDRADA